jgi:hypothetical protein
MPNQTRHNEMALSMVLPGIPFLTTHMNRMYH